MNDPKNFDELREEWILHIFRMLIKDTIDYQRYYQLILEDGFAEDEAREILSLAAATHNGYNIARNELVIHKEN